MAKNGISAEEAIKAVIGSKGFITTIAKRLNVTRSYIYQLQKKYSTFAQAIEDEREEQKDFTEGKLFEQIDQGNMTGIIFYLKTQAKDRGYIEKQQIEQVNVEVSELTDEQLERIANGEDLYTVATSGKSGTRIKT